ncbi:MAG: hypothetical protein ACR2KP_15135 [Egibacteraceae bacterium]
MELHAFIGAAQNDAWDELVKRYGGNHDTAQSKYADRLASELDNRGAVDVLRHGVVDQGVTLRRCIREVFRTGTVGQRDPGRDGRAEEPADGQGVDKAIAQYRTDRELRNRTLARAVVHFAVDSQRVAMTTRLAGFGHPVPAVQPRARRRGGQPAEHVWPHDGVPVGAGVAARRLAGPARPVRARGEARERPEEAE